MARKRAVSASVEWLLQHLPAEGAAQKALADAIGRSEGYISRVLSGEAYLREKYRKPLADFAGVQPSEVPFIPDASNRHFAQKVLGVPLQIVQAEALTFLDTASTKDRGEETTPMPEEKLRAFWMLASPDERRMAVELMISHWRNGTLGKEHAARGRLPRTTTK